MKLPSTSLLVKQFIVLLLCPLAAIAAGEITVKDTSGTVRFVSNTESDEALQFAVEKKSGTEATGSVVKLTNSATGEVYEATVENGVATFSGLEEGTYVISASDEGLLFVNVQVVAATGATSSLVVPVVGGLVAVGGTTAIVIAATDDDDEDSTPLSPNT